MKEEVIDRQHLISVIKSAKQALKAEDADKLRKLSNQTIHCSTCCQDPGTISLAVVLYSLSKIIIRSHHNKIKSWQSIVQKTLSQLDLAIKALQDKNDQAFSNYLTKARSSLEATSGNLKPYIQEVLKNASINKACKLYEHGLSLGQTAKILGLNSWELNEYSNRTKNLEEPYSKGISAKERAKLALEFLS